MNLPSMLMHVTAPKDHVDEKAHKTTLLQWERQSITNTTIGEAMAEVQNKCR
jgi:hypothetical protein